MSTTYIYVIGREDGPVKVGVSNGPGGRLSSLQTGCPFQLQLLHTQAMGNRDHALRHEQWFHRSYKEKRLLGEWFDISAEEAIDMIETCLSVEDWYEQTDARMRLPA